MNLSGWSIDLPSFIVMILATVWAWSLGFRSGKSNERRKWMIDQ